MTRLQSPDYARCALMFVLASPLAACDIRPGTVGGIVTDLKGSGLTLQNNGGDDLVVSAAGSFSFGAYIPAHGAYSVTIKRQPTQPSQTCVVENGKGRVPPEGGSNGGITSVRISCTTDTFNVSGTVTGLAGAGLVLTNNDGDDLTINAAGAFKFPTPIASGAPYQIKVKAQPRTPWQTCTITNGSGQVGAGHVLDVALVCKINSYAVGGTVSGLAGTGLVLQNNHGDDQIISGNGPFAFSSPVESGATYSLTVKTQPSNPWQTCDVSAASGTITGSDVTSVVVNCQLDQFTVGGTVSGLVGTGLVLQNNGGSDLSVNSNGAFTFPAPVDSGAAYAVTVKTQPATPSQTCVVASGASTVGAANVTSVTVTCTTNQYTVGGTVNNLDGAGLVLQNNGADDLPVVGSGTLNFTFATALASGRAYAVTVKTQPAGQLCSASAATGTVTSANLTGVRIDCVPLQCQRLGWKFGSGDWTCPAGLRMPTTTELSLVSPCITDADTGRFSYTNDIAVSVGGCNCKWHDEWCDQPSIETIRGGRMCGDSDQLHICVR